jgi:formylglycine-generating enzyme required for sulfatase activity
MLWVSGPFCRPQRLDAGVRCLGESRQLEFCIDRFEYPNQVGVKPVVLATYVEAADYCHAEGKRLCRDAEWTLACRGVARVSACNTGDGSLRIPVEQFRTGHDIARAFASIDGRRASRVGDCAGESGAQDMLGNVQEWVQSEHPADYPAALKGGHYNQVSIGCERSIQTRHPLVRYPTTGLRCCADALVDLPAPR